MIDRSIRSLAAAALLLLAASASAQTTPDQTPPPTPPPAEAPTGAPTFSLLTTPPSLHVLMEGRANLRGSAPIDVPTWMDGRFSLVVEGAGAARTQGVVYIPPRQTGNPVLLSEPAGLSAGLVVRSFNYPGVPDITADRVHRGLALALAGTGAGISAGRAHLRYRDRLKEFGGYASDRARDERRERNNWFTYGLAVWGASAVDYWIRPRFELEDPTTSHVTLIVPRVSRSSVAWRSLLVPGAGQEYGNHSTRGLVWLGSFLAAGAAFTIADNAVVRNQTKLDWARVLVDSAGPSERPLRLRDVEVRQNDLQSSEDVRRGLRYAMVGIYVANVMDALLMPIREPETTEPPRVSAAFPITRDGAGIALRFRY
ncbi:MAG: hypothetical protein ACM3JJ_09165 [Hyphomicrobiales bacterium]